MFDRQKGGAPSIALNRTGELLASTALWSGGMRLWHPGTGQELLSIPDTSMVAYRPFWGTMLEAQLFRREEEHHEVWEIVPGREYRTLTHRPNEAAPEFRGISVSPDGRLVAAGVREGAAIWDLVRGEERAVLRVGRSSVWFEPVSGDLFTNGSGRLLRWPVAAPSPEERRFGPPQIWNNEGHFDSAVRGSRDGKTIAVSGWPGLHPLVFHAETPRKPIRLGPFAEVRTVDVSPDGRWVVTPSFEGSKVAIWDARTGERIHQLVTTRLNSACFSPDGRWLAVLWFDGLTIWEVETWREVRKIPPPWWWVGRLTFSPDSRLLAFESGRGMIRLVDPSTGVDLAVLEDPNQDRAGFMTFSPDGTQLIVASNDSQTIHVWNLRAIRRQLVELDLDWAIPSYPPAPQPPLRAIGPPLLQIRVDPGK